MGISPHPLCFLHGLRYIFYMAFSALFTGLACVHDRHFV